MMRWTIAALLAFIATPAFAGPSFDVNFLFSRGPGETYTGTGQLLTADGATANGDGSFTYVVEGANGTITTNFNNPVSVYTINGVGDFFGADNRLTVSPGGTVTYRSLLITFDGGPGGALFVSGRSDVFAGEAVFDLDRLAITAAATAGAVPEPAMWAMMIVGMGLAGAALRRHVRASDAAFTARMRTIAASGDA